jgi:hypothetical protein
MYNVMYSKCQGGKFMSKMVRKQIYIESRQDTTLKQQARILGVTEAKIIRQAIDHQMTSVRLGARDQKAWEREKAFITKRMAKGPAPGGRRWKREDAYEERLMRYDR